MRGKIVDWSPKAINQLFHLHSVEYATFNEMVLAPSDNQLEMSLKMVAIEGTRWQLSRGEVRTIIAAVLNPEAKVLVAFVKTNLLPITHDNTLLADRVLLVYAIIKNLSIDVGKIVKCACKKVGRLFFPQLIIM